MLIFQIAYLCYLHTYSIGLWCFSFLFHFLKSKLSIHLDKNILCFIDFIFFQSRFVWSDPAPIACSLCWYVWIHKAGHRPNFCLQILYPFINSAYYSLSLLTEKQTGQPCCSCFVLSLSHYFPTHTLFNTHTVNYIIIHSIYTNIKPFKSHWLI